MYVKKSHCLFQKKAVYVMLPISTRLLTISSPTTLLISPLLQFPEITVAVFAVRARIEFGTPRQHFGRFGDRQLSVCASDELGTRQRVRGRCRESNHDTNHGTRQPQGVKRQQ